MYIFCTSNRKNKNYIQTIFGLSLSELINQILYEGDMKTKKKNDILKKS